MRYAIYFTPRQEDALARRAALWLGRDAFTGATTSTPAINGLAPAEIAFHTAAARRYGFHATLKAPFRLASGETEASLMAAISQFSETVEPFAIPRLSVTNLDGFLALMPDAPYPPLNKLADDVVRAFERFRAPLTDAEIERRNLDDLSPAEFSNLCQWGYPYVFRSFRFHMTLTGRLDAREEKLLTPAVDAFFADILAEPVPVEGVALFVEPEAGAPFNIHSYHALGQARSLTRNTERRSA